MHARVHAHARTYTEGHVKTDAETGHQECCGHQQPGEGHGPESSPGLPERAGPCRHLDFGLPAPEL